MKNITPKDLEDCSREAIHLIGSIRPAGILLAIDRGSLEIRFASSNAEALLGLAATDLLGRRLSECVPHDLAAPLAAAVGADTAGGPDAAHMERLDWSGTPHIALANPAGPDAPELAIVEILPDAVTTRDEAAEFQRAIRGLTVQPHANVNLMMELTAKHVRSLTGFGRVMVYRFHPDGAGYVAAESARDGLEPYLGLHFPASDIPEQARILFVRNRVRAIEDVDAEPVPILGPPRRSLDLSDSVLRAVSPVHLQYLRNMGVQASLAISLVLDGKLWGLVACHHDTARQIPWNTIVYAQAVSQMLSVLVERNERVEEMRFASRGRVLVDAAVDGAATHLGGVRAGLAAAAPQLHKAIHSHGFALVHDDAVIGRSGDVPDVASIRRAANWVRAQGGDGEVVHSDGIADTIPDWLDDPRRAAGILAARLDASSRGLTALWFRLEHTREVRWAGNPDAPVQRTPDGRLHPRGSFEVWRGERKGQCRPWNEAEIEVVRNLVRRVAGSEHRPQDLGTEPWAQSRDAVLLLDAGGHVVAFNSCAERALGGRENIAVGAPLDLTIDVGLHPNLDDVLGEVADGAVWVGKDTPLELGNNRFFEPAILPIQTEPGDSPRFALALRDVTEQQRLQSQLGQAQRLASIGELTGGLAHNFNNLLSVILGSVSIAKRQLQSTHPVHEELDAIQAAANDASGVVRDLLNFARQSKATAAAFDPVERLERLADLLRRTFPKRIRLVTELPDETFRIAMDPTHFDQVVMNLALNARDAIPGEGRITLRTFLERVEPPTAGDGSDPGLRPGTYATIEVADTGTGIPDAVLVRVFDPFFTTKGEEGTGLGLSSCFGLVSRAGGQLDVRSSPGHGSVFSMRIPRADPASASNENRVPADGNGQPPKSVLLVDDNPDVRDVVARILEQQGFEVHVASSGEEALAAVGSTRFDALVTDFAMPGMNGIELIRESRKRADPLPTVLISGETVDVPESLDHLVFLPKPFGVGELMRALASAREATP